MNALRKWFAGSSRKTRTVSRTRLGIEQLESRQMLSASPTSVAAAMVCKVTDTASSNPELLAPGGFRVLLHRRRRHPRPRTVGQRRDAGRNPNGQGHQPRPRRLRHPLPEYHRPHVVLHGQRRHARRGAVDQRRHQRRHRDGHGHQPWPRRLQHSLSDDRQRDPLLHRQRRHARPGAVGEQRQRRRHVPGQGHSAGQQRRRTSTT